MANPLKQFWNRRNVAGLFASDIYDDRKAGEAEREVSRIRQVGAGATGDYKGEKFLNLLKFGANFIPGVGKILNMGLSGIDILADKAYAKKMEKKMESMRPKGKGPHADWINQQYDAILSQVKQAGSASMKESLISNLMNIGMKSGIKDKLITDKTPWMKDWMEKNIPLQSALSEWKPGEKFLGNIAKKKLSKESSLLDLVSPMGESAELMDPFLSQMISKDPLNLSMQNMISQLPEKQYNLPSGLDWLNLLSPYYSDMVRGDSQVTIPSAPRSRRRRY